MLKSIHFKNYRAFPDGWYPIRPITVFIGANSVGKTSALQLPLLLHQTALVSHSQYRSAIRVHGRDVSFGEPQNIFYRKDTSKLLSVRLQFSSDGLLAALSKSLPFEIADHYSSLTQTLLGSLSRKGKGLASEGDFKKLARYFESEPSDLVGKGASFADEFFRVRDKNLDILADEDRRYLMPRFAPLRKTARLPVNRRLRVGLTSIKNVAKSDVTRSLAVLAALTRLDSDLFDIEYDVDQKRVGTQGPLTIRRVAVFNGDAHSRKLLIGITINEEGSLSISSELMADADLQSYDNTLATMIDAGTDIFSFVRSVAPGRFLTPELVRTILAQSIAHLQGYFDLDDIRHVGPLRAHPKRFYFLDTAQAGSGDGDILVEALREDANLRDQVNAWLTQFEINIDVDQFREIIHRLSVKGANGLDLDITDVGFGISQILPIIVEGLLSPKDSVIVVEQPEIHLHPSMQAELGDLFISMAGIEKRKTSDGSPRETKNFLIETHSEYFLNRLRRRLIEGSISHNDIAIVIVERADGERAKLTNVHIGQDGGFEWPKGFRDVVLEDSVAIAKAMRSSP